MNVTEVLSVLGDILAESSVLGEGTHTLVPFVVSESFVNDVVDRVVPE